MTRQMLDVRQCRLPLISLGAAILIAIGSHRPLRAADAPPKGDGPIDLLQDADVKKAISGHWTLKDGVLTGDESKAGPKAVARIPFTYNGPPGSYDVDFTFRRTAGNTEFALVGPLGDNVQCKVSFGLLDGAHGGIHGLRDRQTEVGGDNGPKVVNDKDQKGHVSVRTFGNDTDITVQLDGKPFLHGKGPRKKLMIGDELTLKDPKALGFAVRGGSTVEFKDVKLTPAHSN